jgi:hypothetical protein
MSMVGRNILGLQPVGDGLIKDKFSLCFLYIYIPLCIIIIISERCIYNVHACWLLLCMAHCLFLLCCSMNLDYLHVWLLHSFMLDFKLIITRIQDQLKKCVLR